MPAFTPESAAKAGALGNIAKQRARELHAARLASAANGQEFQAETLARVREVLTDTLQRLAQAKDPKDRELLARATSHLAETERKLAGRPLPGTLTRRTAGDQDPTPRPGLPQPR